MAHGNVCDNCGHTHTDKNTVEERNDPYLEELYGEEVAEMWCERCYYYRHEEI